MSLSRVVQLISWLMITLPSQALSDSEAESKNDQHLCQRIENYTVTSTETYNEPVVVNTFTWCLQIPPRCLKTRSEMRQRYRIKTETKERNIEECCEGYKEASAIAKRTLGIMCEPVCEKCVGKCVGPNECLCDPGFRGDDCTAPCANGTWGAECREKCDCGQSELPCNQVSGHCHCPPGYFGPKCKRCTAGLWGLECRFGCECGHPKKCHHETGACIVENSSNEQLALNIPEDAREERMQVLREMISGQIEDSTRDIDVTEYTTQGCVFPCRNNDAAEDCDSENGAGCTNNDVPIEQVASTYLRSTTEQNYVEAWKIAATERIKEPSIAAETTKNSVEVSVTESGEDLFEKSYPSATTNLVTTPTSDTNYLQVRTQEHEEITTSTARPVIVLVSVPERRRNLDRLKFMAENPLLRHIDENEEPRDRAPPKTDYVKTAKKAEEVQASAIPLDIALIVVASIVSLGLTSLAVVMILHMRSKLFETVRLSIYDDGKTKVQDHAGGVGIGVGGVGPSAGRIPTIVPGSMQQPQTRLSPMYSPSPESATILTVDAIEQLSGYANGAATIGLRISGNLRDLLQDGHYDRPPATLVRLHAGEFQAANAEHVYDEIPLQSTPLCVRKHS